MLRKHRQNPVFWGAAGAGILFICNEDNTLMLMHRSPYVEQPGTWGIPGGSVKGEGFYDSEKGTERPTDDTFWEGAYRETEEECGEMPQGFSNLNIEETIDFQSGSFIYRNFICNVTLAQKIAWTPRIVLNWENDDFEWFSPDALPSNLHFGVVFALKELGLLK